MARARVWHCPSTAYMNKVYADKSLPYKQDVKFQFPENFNPCKSEFYDDYVVDDTQEQSMEGVFD